MVPADYVELRALRTRDSSQRHDAEQLLRTLDRPPWLFTKILARIFDQPAIGFWLLYGVPLILFSIICGLGVQERLMRKLRRPSDDLVATLALFSLCAGIIFVLVLIPRLFGIYANRRAVDRSRLLAGLAARAPEHKGGRAQCRVCGAPLEVAKGALIARCLYCETDSVLVVATPLLTKTRRTVDEIGRALSDAAAFDRKARHDLLLSVARELQRYGVRACFLLIPILVFAWDDHRVQGTSAVPGWGIAGLVFVTFYLIWMLTLGSIPKVETEDVNDVPKWVGIAVPISVWILWAYFGQALIALLSSTRLPPTP